MYFVYSVYIYCVHGAVIVGSRVFPMSVSQPVLNISSPEFVPRVQVAAASEMSFQYNSNTVPAEGCVLGLGNSDSRAPASLSSSIGEMGNPRSAGDVFSYSGRSRGYRSCDETMLTGCYYLPQHFANITVAESLRPPGLSYRAPHRRDAYSQTADVKLVNACTGGSSVLLVDASTNTPPYDETGGLQQAQVKYETKVNMHTELGVKLNASHPKESSGQSLGIDHRLPNRSTVAGSQSNRWADCWHHGQSPGSIESDEKYTNLFSDANKNRSPSATNCAASRRESSGLVDREHDTLPKSSRPSAHEMHSSCDCIISNCPFASSTVPLGGNRNVTCEQSADASGNLFATSHAPAAMQVDLVL